MIEAQDSPISLTQAALADPYWPKLIIQGLLSRRLLSDTTATDEAKQSGSDKGEATITQRIPRVKPLSLE